MSQVVSEGLYTSVGESWCKLGFDCWITVGIWSVTLKQIPCSQCATRGTKRFRDKALITLDPSKFSIAFKRLTAVEVDACRSHQSEFQGVGAFAQLFGQTRQEFPNVPMTVLGNESDTSVSFNNLTWYNAREKQAKRSPEYRLYYRDPPNATANDLLMILRDDRSDDRPIALVIVEEGSTYESQLLALSGISDVNQISEGGQAIATKIQDFDVGLTSVFMSPLLDLLGWRDLDLAEVGKYSWDVEKALAEFGNKFPTTLEMSTYVFNEINPSTDLDIIDETLVMLWKQEEALFKAMEKRLFMPKIHSRVDDWDAFIDLAKSILNRRRSRAGYALENQLELILSTRKMKYSRNQFTEPSKKPDFLFPSINKYRDQSYPATNLRMLGVKTSLRERWEQILGEADRIKRKHLLTLESNISVKQRKQIDDKDVQLVIPRGIPQVALPDLAPPITLREFLESVPQ